MDAQNSTFNGVNFLTLKIPKSTLTFLLIVFLLGWSSQSAFAQCDDEAEIECRANPLGNGASPEMAKLYCSNSSAVSNGIINCTTAADTDGCGVDASLTTSDINFTSDIANTYFGDVPEVCYTSNGQPLNSGGVLFNKIQWIRFATPIGINSVKLQGVGKMDAWAVFHAGSIDTSGKSDAVITDEIEAFSAANLQYVEDACSAENQYKTWINPDAVINSTDINVYFIALMYDVISNGSINFKTKECEFIQFCVPEVLCPNTDITFCEGTGDLVDIQAWLDQFSNTDCGNDLTWKLTGNGLDVDFDGLATTIASLEPGTYTLTNTLTNPDTQAVIASCSSDIIVYYQPEAGTGSDDSYCETDAGLSSVDLDALVTGGDDGGAWTDAGDGSVSSPLDMSAFGPGEYTFTYTVTPPEGSDCVPDNTSVTITIYYQPEAGTGSDDSYCETDAGLSSVDLDALVTGGDDGGAWTDAGDGSVSSPLDMSAFGPGEYTFTYTVTPPEGSDCVPDNTSVTITIYYQPEAGTGSDDSYCETDAGLSSVDLDALVTGGDDGGAWTDAGDGSVSSPLDMSAFGPGEYTFTYTVTPPEGSDCVPDNTSVTITIYYQPEAGTGSDDSYCETDAGLSSVDLDALVTGGDAGGAWTDAGDGSVSSPLDMSAFGPGEYTFTYTVTPPEGSDCVPDNTSVTITIYYQPEAGTGSDDSYCETDAGLSSVDLDALVTGGDAGGAWTDAGDGSVSSPLDMSAFGPGEYTFTYTVTPPEGSDCVPDNTSVTITIYYQPEAGTGSDDSYCETDAGLSSVDLDALVTGGDDGGAWTDAGDGSVSSPLDMSAFGPGEYTFTYTVTPPEGSDCVPDNTSVTITIYYQPEAGTGSDDSYCETDAGLSSVDLDALVTGGDAGGAWTDAGDGSVSSPLDMSAFGPGEYTFTYTVTPPEGSDCVPDNTSVTITIYYQPEAGTGSDDSYCETDAGLSSVDLDALVTGGDAGGAWTDAGDGSVSSPLDMSAFGPGEYTFTYTVTPPEGSDCVPDNTSVTITIYYQPEAGTGSDDSYCETDAGLSSVDLDALVTGGDAGGAWTDAGDGSVSSPLDMSAFGPGEYTFTYTVTPPEGSDCVPDNTSVTITIYYQPEAGTGSDDSYCETDAGLSSVDLDALVTGGDAGGAWTDAGDGSVSSPLDMSAFGPGEYTFTYTVTPPEGSDCVPDNTSVTITIYYQPEAGTGSDDSYCETDAGLSSVDLDALVTGGDAGGAWTDAGDGSVSSPLDMSAFGPGEYTFTYTVTPPEGSDCVPDNTSVTITIYYQPEAGTGSDDSYCETDAGLSSVDLDALVTGGDAGGAWTDAGDGSVSSPLDMSAFGPGEYTFTYTVTPPEGSDCVPDNTSVTITIYYQPEAGTGSDDSYCETDAGLSSVDLDALVTGGDAGGAWTDAGDGSVSSPLDMSAFGPGEYTFTYTVTPPEGSDCVPDNTSVTITIYYQPEAGTGSDDSYCETDAGLSSVDLDALVTGGDAGGAWTDAGDGSVSSPLDMSAFGPGEYTFTYTVTPPEGSDCVPDNTSVTITVNPLPTVDVEIGDTTLCVVAGDVTTVTASPLPPGSYDYVWTVPVGWSDPDGVIVGDNPGNVASFKTGLIGVYSVTITNTDTDCTAMSSGTINPVFNNEEPILTFSDYCSSDAPDTLIDFAEAPEGTDLVWFKIVDGNKVLIPAGELGADGYPLAPTTPGSYSYFVELAIADCTTAFNLISSITVFENPECSITGPADVCEDVVQTYSYSGTTENVSYEWSVSGDASIDGDNTASSVDITPTGVGSYTVSLMVTDNTTSCTSMCSYSVTTYDCCDSETAYAYDALGDQGSSNICFLDNDIQNFNRWGWAQSGLNFEETASDGSYNSYTFNLYAANGNSCDPATGPGTLVGNVTVTRDGDFLIATYDVSNAPEGEVYKLYTGHFNASCQTFPDKKRFSRKRLGTGSPYTVAPGQYTESASANGGDTLEIQIAISEFEGCLDNFYVIAHAEVELCTLEPTSNQVEGISKIANEDLEDVDQALEFKGDFTMYPIPFNNEINVAYNFNYDTDINIMVYDIKGVMVYNKVINDYKSDTKGKVTIDMSRQSNQMFFVRLTTSKDVITKTAITEGK